MASITHDLASPGRLATVLFTRTILNTSYRVVYPFLPAISRGLGVSLTAAGLLLTARSVVGLTSPLFGPLSDRHGRRTMMLAGLVMLVVAGALLTALPFYGAALIAFALFGLAKTVYDPALQAYLGDGIPYAHRGRVMGTVEFSWSAAWLLGVPATGFLIEHVGWHTPFAAIALLGIAALVLTLRLPQVAHCRYNPHGLALPNSSLVPTTPRQQGMTLTGNRSAWMVLVVGLLLVFANENLLLVYGAWMEASFGLSVGALGLASVVIGLAEATAEGASAAFVDRLGKKRAVAGGFLLTAGAYLLLPVLHNNLALALAGLAIPFVAFEFTIVSCLPLVSELAPAARGTLMALNVAALSLGRMIGSLAATPLWLHGGLALNGAVSCIATVIACGVLWWFVEET